MTEAVSTQKKKNTSPQVHPVGRHRQHHYDVCRAHQCLYRKGQFARLELGNHAADLLLFHRRDAPEQFDHAMGIKGV